MDCFEESAFDVDVHVQEALRQMKDSSTSHEHAVRGGDSLISGVLEEPQIKEEDCPNPAAQFTEAASVMKRDMRHQDHPAEARSLPCQAPPAKRQHFSHLSPTVSLSNSSPDAHSPSDLGNVFTNRAFQSSCVEYLWPLDEPSAGSCGEFAETTSAVCKHESDVEQRDSLSPAQQALGASSCSLQRAFSERVSSQKLLPKVEPHQQRPLSFKPWSQVALAPLFEVSAHQTREAVVSFGVQADKGFQFSGREGIWISQKKNHFQITCITGVSGAQWAVAVPVVDSCNSLQQPSASAAAAAYSQQLVLGFQLSLAAVKAESPLDSPPIGLEQSEANRARRSFAPVPLQLPGGGQCVRAVCGRLHFSAATANNQRRRGDLHPDQRFFQLVVGLDAVTQTAAVPLTRFISGMVIVRASNPGQFESTDAAEQPELSATPGSGVWISDRPGVAHFAGRVGINTRTPGEALTVNGNLQLHGSLLQPSDARIKSIQRELSPADQLANISRIRIYNYSLSPTVSDTGVIAQEVAGVLPDAVRKSSTQRVPATGEPLLLVNKDRIYMENVGAVRQLGELTASLDRRIGELERMRSKLCRLRDSLRSSSSSWSSQQQQPPMPQSKDADGDGNGVEREANQRSQAPESATAAAAASSKTTDKEATPTNCSAAVRNNKHLIAILTIALLAILCCFFCAVAALLLAERLAPSTGASGGGGGGGGSIWTTVTEQLPPKETTFGHLVVTSESTKAPTQRTSQQPETSPSMMSSMLASPTSAPITRPPPDDGVIRPGVDRCPSCRPVRCCQPPPPLPIASAAGSRRPLGQRIVAAAAASAAATTWELRSARLMSAGLGEWSLLPGRTALCMAGDAGTGRNSLKFGDCVGGNVTVRLMLGAEFPAAAELHLRLETSNLTAAAYCPPAGVYGRCQGDRRRLGLGEAGEFPAACVPVAGGASDCNLGPAASHLRHQATLRFAMGGLPNPCQMEASALGETFLEVRFLIERQTYGCD